MPRSVSTAFPQIKDACWRISGQRACLSTQLPLARFVRSLEYVLASWASEMVTAGEPPAGHPRTSFRRRGGVAMSSGVVTLMFFSGLKSSKELFFLHVGEVKGLGPN